MLIQTIFSTFSYPQNPFLTSLPSLHTHTTSISLSPQTQIHANIDTNGASQHKLPSLLSPQKYFFSTLKHARINNNSRKKKFFGKEGRGGVNECFSRHPQSSPFICHTTTY
uniref:Uncharacterized protein n=1 Tax=Meloidogyne enterolobii TaxID=390850 RepID=A0A6V7WIC3_MELEN|nr:unnamed protein product [Meloidogyne enterolobii]